MEEEVEAEAEAEAEKWSIHDIDGTQSVNKPRVGIEMNQQRHVI